MKGGPGVPRFLIVQSSELRKVLFKILLFALIFVGMRQLSPYITLVYNTDTHLTMHILVESSSIAVSFFIYIQFTLLFKHYSSRNLLLLGWVFFMVGALDLLHMFSFKDMPTFFFQSSVQKATYFWLIARMTEALLLFTVFFRQDRMISVRRQRLYLAGAIGYLALAAGVVLLLENRLPLLVMDGHGTTVLKNGLEYLISFIHMGNVLLLMMKYRRNADPELLHVLLASFLIVMSELFFTTYKSVNDVDNLLGHIYKIIGYYYLLKGFSHTRIQAICSQIERVQREFVTVLQKHQGIIFEFTLRNGRFIHTLCEGSLLSLIHLDPKMVVNRELGDFLRPDLAAYMEGFYMKAWKGEDQLYETELDYGVVGLVELKPIVENGQVLQVIGSCVNITHLRGLQDKLRENELRMEKLDAVSQLAASISHEVRNPLTVTRGFLQLLLRTPVSDIQRSYVELALSELDRAGGIITDYLTFAKPDIETVEVFEVEEELKHVVSFVTPLANMQLVDIGVVSGRGSLISGEKAKFRQCILNLMKNGIEAMPMGGTMRIGVSRGVGHAVISIEDTGLGMDEEQVSRLGTPYYSTKEKGTGLGMMVVFSLVHAMKGHVEVISARNSGTTFKLRFPLAGVG